MSVTPRVLYSGGQAPNAAAIMFTAGVNVKTLITEWSFTNTDTVARELTLYLVRSGGSVSNATKLLGPQSIQPDETFTPPTGQVLGEGDTIRWVADAASVITCPGVSGYTITT